MCGVNCIAPGLIRTDFARALWEDPKCSPAAPPTPRCAASVSLTKSLVRRCIWRPLGSFMIGPGHRGRWRRDYRVLMQRKGINFSLKPRWNKALMLKSCESDYRWFGG